MLVPGAAHLGGSARTGEGRGSVLTIYVYMRIHPLSCQHNRNIDSTTQKSKRPHFDIL